jgi:peptidoglycan-associated lipoprotein
MKKAQLFSNHGLNKLIVGVVLLALAGCAQNTDGAISRGGVGIGLAGSGPGSAQDFAINVGDKVFFESDSSELTGTAVATLDKQASWLGRYGQHQIKIEGHADERGTREYNFALSARRAEAVKSYLSAKGVASKRLSTIAYGKERPVAVCDNISCWSQNRRAATLLGAGAGS